MAYADMSRVAVIIGARDSRTMSPIDADLVRGHFRVDGRNHSAHGCDQASRIGRRAHDERDLGPEREIGVRAEAGNVELRTRRLGEAAVLRVGDDTNDRHPWRVRPESQPMANGIRVIAPDLARERLADHERRVACVRVVVREHSSAKNGDAHRLEVTGRDDAIVGERIGPIGAEWASLERHREVAATAVER